MKRDLLIGTALFLSGLAGISYEILYGRMLGGLVGDQFAVSSSVLITFLLGVGLGARFAYLFAKRLWLIELLIGFYGLAFAAGLRGVESFLYLGRGLGIGGPILGGIILLLPPALLIGCSVPLFAGYLSRMDSAFQKVYALYNLAAGITALLIEFILIRLFGISGTVYAFCALNTATAVLLFNYRNDLPDAPKWKKPETGRGPLFSLILASAGSAVFQLFMVKISEMAFGPFRETFAIVLAIILFGIAFGSWLVKRFDIGLPDLLLACLAGLALFLLLFEPAMYLYAALYEVAVANGPAIILLKSFILLAFMGIPCVAFGATVPALVKARGEVAGESGYLLYVSSLANVLGFLLMALVLHRYFDYGVQVLLISLLVLIGISLYVANYGRKVSAAIIIFLLAVGLHRGKWDENLLYLSYTSFHSKAALEEKRAEFNFPDKFKGYQDVFSINWSGGHPFFFINGYISFPMDNPSEKIVGTIGPMFSPKTDDALVLGLGSGSTASAVGLLFGRTDVVEINPVVRENQYRMKKWNFDIENIPNMNFIVDDAIHFTKTYDKQYDMVLNTVTSPIYFSSSKLYTSDFFRTVKKRIKPGGIYITWFDGRVGDKGAEIILNSLRGSFDHCSILAIKAAYFLLIASDQPVKLQHPYLADTAKTLKLDLMGNHERMPRLFAYNLLNSDAYGLVKNSPDLVNTIDRPILEFEMAHLKPGDFKHFQKRLLSGIDLDTTRGAIEPAMKYDPVEQAAYINMILPQTTISTRLNRLGRVYVSDFDKRLEEMLLGIYGDIAGEVNSADTRHEYGYQLSTRGRYELAIAEFEKAVALDPTHKFTAYNIAAAYEKKMNYPKAIEWYIKAGTLDPKDHAVPYCLARVHEKTKEFGKGLEEVDRAIKMKENGKYWFLKGRLLEALGRKDEAVTALKTALDKSPKDRDIQLALSRHIAKW